LWFQRGGGGGPSLGAPFTSTCCSTTTWAGGAWTC
jgi:hypothetical protein